MRTEHVLIIRFSALGDVAMTVPVVSSVARQYPDVRFTVLSRPGMKPLFEGIAPNIGFMGADLEGEYRGLGGLRRLYHRLTAKQFTAVADLHDVLRSKLLRLCFNMERYKVAHIDKHRSGKRRLLKERPLTQQPSAFSNYADVFARLGYPVKPEFKSVFADKGTSSADYMPENSAGRYKGDYERCHILGHGPNIGIAPFAAHEGKVYPLPLLEKVIRELIKLYPDSRLLLFGGGKREQEVMSQWCARYKQCVAAHNHAKGLRDELRLMSRLDVMLSMDSANMHLASLTATPVVSVWGTTHPYAGFMGWGQSMDNAVQLELPCRPCSIYGNRPCRLGDTRCMNDIAPETIVERMAKIVGQAHRGEPDKEG